MRRDRERGSALLLVPAGFLVLLILAAITFDYSHLYLAKRELTSVAEAAAQDAVTAGIDQARLRTGEGIHLDQALVDEALEQALAAHGRDLRIISAQAVVLSDTEVQVLVTASVDYVFVRAVPGAPHDATITARATADAI